MMTMYLTPYRRLAGLRQVMDRMIDETLNEAAPIERELTLAVDVLAEDEAYVVRALVPGLEAEAVNIEILNNTVSLRGEFPAEDVEDGRYLTSELPHGKFSRMITLPAVLDAAKAEAALKNGVLTLRIPKAESHRPRLIKISNN
jgi:HSP20 family protein